MLRLAALGERILAFIALGLVAAVQLFAVTGQGLVAFLCMLPPLQAAAWSRVDWTLLIALFLSGMSAIIAATNDWWALRSLGLSVSGCVIYWRVGAIPSGQARAFLLAAVAKSWVALK